MNIKSTIKTLARLFTKRPRKSRPMPAAQRQRIETACKQH